MTDLYLDDGRRHYNESLPPSLLGGGGAPSPFATPGDRSAAFASAFGVDPGTIADRPTLIADPAVGDAAFTGPAWHAGAYIMLGDGDWVSWNGTGWVDGPVPPPPPPVQLVLDPATLTVAEVIAWVEDHYGDHEGTTPEQRAELQAILDAERAGLNRATLVAFLDGLAGLI